MPAFVCSKCGHYGNTALSNWWITDGKDQRCHVCILEDADANKLDKLLWMKRPRFEKAPKTAKKGMLLK